MSETRAEARKTQPLREATQTAAKGARDETAQAADTVQLATEDGRYASDAMVDTVARTADAAAEISQRVADQSQEVMMAGVRAAAGMNGRIVEIGYGRGHRWLASAAQAMDVYQDASGTSAEPMLALFSSCLSLGRGIQQFQHTWLDLMDHAVERASHRPQDFMRCKTAAEFAELQRDVFVETINHAFDASAALLESASRVAQEAMRPLQGRGRKSVMT